MGFGKTILFSEMSPPAHEEAKFNDWYDQEHIPLRVAIPGFVSAQRYLADGNDRNYLAVYEMNDPSVLKSPEYDVVKNQPSELTKYMLSSVSGFTRYIGNLLGEQWKDTVTDPLDQAKYLYAVFFTVPTDELSEFDAWYTEDHVPILLECPEWLGTRRFEIIEAHPGDYNRLALHYLTTPEALNSPARAKARTTPWRDKLAVKPWFKGHYLVFKNHQNRQFSKTI
jgi:hypothetical protein